eukprot:CAMPEP_0174231438 /NCGR_PEP_ID=MMETSP0417-20130205/1964_1 /TAXON_ID=242541 /ORGANISM="Mayorella sp, Strain BSH-02190019" /LENGTH=477 /DNA_ID=CAMNT_0015309323 /DNA_START=103 /DNA_END=1533 /DNA_ORIENTATION=+
MAVPFTSVGTLSATQYGMFDGVASRTAIPSSASQNPLEQPSGNTNMLQQSTSATVVVAAAAAGFSSVQPIGVAAPAESSMVGRSAVGGPLMGGSAATVGLQPSSASNATSASSTSVGTQRYIEQSVAESFLPRSKITEPDSRGTADGTRPSIVFCLDISCGTEFYLSNLYKHALFPMIMHANKQAPVQFALILFDYAPPYRSLTIQETDFTTSVETLNKWFTAINQRFHGHGTQFSTRLPISEALIASFLKLRSVPSSSNSVILLTNSEPDDGITFHRMYELLTCTRYGRLAQTGVTWKTIATIYKETHTSLSVISPRPLLLLNALYRASLSPDAASNATSRSFPLPALGCVAKVLLSGFAGVEFETASDGRAVVPSQVVWQGHLELLGQKTIVRLLSPASKSQLRTERWSNVLKIESTFPDAAKFDEWIASPSVVKFDIVPATQPDSMFEMFLNYFEKTPKIYLANVLVARLMIRM